jgi:trk system potassium uptake protein TrkA
MKIIVIGCGRVGAQLANRLSAQGHQVTVVDISSAAFDNLDASFRGRTLEGDVLAQDMLRRAGIESVDALAIATSSDTLNAVIGHVARTVYRVPNVVARNYEPRWAGIYETFDIQAVGPSSWGAQRMEEMLTDASLRTVFSAGNGEVEFYEILVPGTWHGKRLGDLVTHGGCMAIALTRAGKATLPNVDATLEAGDV